MVLKLSDDVPADWRETFDEAWTQGALAMRRKAVVERNTLTSTCMTYELQGQIDQLSEVISATNECYSLIASRQRQGSKASSGT
jgi:hypothetical protein